MSITSSSAAWTSSFTSLLCLLQFGDKGIGSGTARRAAGSPQTVQTAGRRCGWSYPAAHPPTVMSVAVGKECATAAGSPPELKFCSLISRSDCSARSSQFLTWILRCTNWLPFSVADQLLAELMVNIQLLPDQRVGLNTRRFVGGNRLWAVFYCRVSRLLFTASCSSCS